MAFSGVGGRHLRAQRAPLPGASAPNLAGEPTLRLSLFCARAWRFKLRDVVPIGN